MTISPFSPFSAYATSYGQDVPQLDAMFQKWLRSPTESVERLSERMSRLAFPDFDPASMPRREARRASLSDRDLVVLPPNPRPQQVVCREASSCEFNAPFTLASAKPFVPGRMVSTSHKAARVREPALTDAPRLKPMVPSILPVNLTLPASELPPAAKKSRLQSSDPNDQVSLERTCSFVTFRV